MKFQFIQSLYTLVQEPVVEREGSIVFRQQGRFSKRRINRKERGEKIPWLFFAVVVNADKSVALG